MLQQPEDEDRTDFRERYPVAFNPTQRGQILLCLFPSPMSAPEISAVTGLTLKTVAAYMWAMKKAGEVKVMGHEVRAGKPGAAAAVYTLTQLGYTRVPKPRGHA